MWGINGKVVSRVGIDKGIGWHRAAAANQLQWWLRIQKGGDGDGDRDGDEEKRRQVDSRRADGKSTEAHSETTWEQNIARRTAQGSPRV